MPTIFTFAGIDFRLYFRDSKEHHLPHVHAAYGSDEAVFSLTDFSILAGRLPPKKRKVAAAWIERNANTLNLMWAEAVEGRPVNHLLADLSE